jgi:hypothetical protein
MTYEKENNWCTSGAKPDALKLPVLDVYYLVHSVNLVLINNELNPNGLTRQFFVFLIYFGRVPMCFLCGL